jgi:hypothetical protein
VTTQYAQRGSENRKRVGWNVPHRIKVYVASLAKATGRSESVVVSEMLDSAINGKPAPTSQESN